jgi:hypothetical protein
LVFGVTLFLSAFLLFLVQPMIAKMILPTLGGAPAVWNTCIVFFQTALLAGYGYAHLSTTWLGPRPQAVLHIGVVLLALLVLPIDAARGWLPRVLRGLIVRAERDPDVLAVILGDPASCLRQIERFENALGLTHLVCRMSVAGISREACRASLTLFTSELLSRVKRAGA